MRYFLSCVSVVMILFACNSDNDSSSFRSEDKGGTEVYVQFDSVFSGEVAISRLGVKRNLVLDTLSLSEKGDVKFEVNLSEPSFLNVYKLNEPGGVILLAHPGDKVIVEAATNYMTYNSKISGSPELVRMDEFVAFMNGYRFYIDSLNQVFQKAAQVNEHFAIEKQINELYKNATLNMEDYTRKFIYDNPSQIGNLQAVRSLDMNRFPEVYAFVDSVLITDYPNSSYVKAYHEQMTKHLALGMNRAAPNFVLPDLNGKNVQLNQFRGKYVLLDFWATWCGPCIKEIPHLVEAYKAFGGEHFEIVSVCVDKPAQMESWKRIVNDHQANWTQLFDGTGEVSQQYRIKYFPTIILLDPDGKVVAKDLRGDAMLKKLSVTIPNS